LGSLKLVNTTDPHGKLEDRAILHITSLSWGGDWGEITTSPFIVVNISLVDLEDPRLIGLEQVLTAIGKVLFEAVDLYDPEPPQWTQQPRYMVKDESTGHFIDVGGYDGKVTRDDHGVSRHVNADF
jgi:hypothetical protein